MVAQSAQEAINNALRYQTCVIGRCLQYTRTWLEIDPRYPSASVAWAEANVRHTDRKPKNGAPVFWTGGSQGYGHIALHTSGGRIRSTDVLSGGLVSTVPLEWFDQHWPGLRYVGWTEDVNGVALPYLKGNATDWRATGDVYVAKLHEGVANSDSVARLRYRLTNHNQMPDNRKPGYGSVYGAATVTAVRYWIENIDSKHGEGGPKDGTQVNNKPANRLFGDNYRVIEE
jgi:hypothetical protein